MVLDLVDVALAKKDGLVHRPKDSAMYRLVHSPVAPNIIEIFNRFVIDHGRCRCQHGDSQRCIHCLPLEPYDDKVLQAANPPIKFLSFHAHLRKLNAGTDGSVPRTSHFQSAIVIHLPTDLC